MSYQTKWFDEWVIQLLRDGGVGFMPSDTIYGLSCRALDQQAVERIYKLKKRDSDKPLIILIADTKMLDLLSISLAQAKAAQKYWPGPLTLICEALSAPAWLHRGSKSLAVRLPDDKQLCELILKTGPIISTSANIQDQKPINSVTEAKSYFGEQLDFYVDGGHLSQRRPSTLARSVNGKLEVIRPGAVQISEEYK